MTAHRSIHLSDVGYHNSIKCDNLKDPLLHWLHMGRIFATKSPSEKDENKLRLLLSTFRDGSGNEKEKDGSTRANWREIERCMTELLDGVGSENKSIFDVIACDENHSGTAYGFSIKSKMLSKTRFEKLNSTSRVYMEIANSPAKFWNAIKLEHALTEVDFRNQQFAQEIGGTILQTVMKWHEEGKTRFESNNPGKILDLEKSCHICVSYSDNIPDKRKYQLHSFDLMFPPKIIWKYKSSKCLTGYDSEYPNEALIDWFALSGGQLKYYPKGTAGRYKTKVFHLLKPKHLTLLDKAKINFPNEFS